MRKLEAAARDRQARKWRERKISFRVGGAFKGCRNCGRTEVRFVGSRKKLVYVSGFQVYRSYRPKVEGWTWKCQECGARDLACWGPDELGMVEHELGREPILGSREVVANKKAETRWRLEHPGVDRGTVSADNPRNFAPVVVRREPANGGRIRELEERLRALFNL